MKTQEWYRRAILVLGLVAISFFAGCSDPTEPEEKPEDIVNTDKPNANMRMLLQKTPGDASTWSSFWELAGDVAGGYFYRGGYNGYQGGGRVSAAGDVTWHSRMAYSPRDVCTTAPTSVVPNALIVTGAQDSDGNGSVDVGYISLFSPAGSLRSQLVYSADTADVWLTSMVAASDSAFLAVGGMTTSTTTYPFVTLFKLTSSGQLERERDAVIRTLAGLYFGYVVRDPDAPASGSVTLYVNSGPDVAAVHRLTFSFPDLAPWTVDWTREIAFTSAEDPAIRDLGFFDGNLYIVGHAEDTTKEQPSSGGFWNSGFAASLTLSGIVRWSRVVRVTGHSENLYAMVPTSDALYVIGSCGGYEQSDQWFGYGWISKLSLDMGSVLTNLTFGNEKYASGFNDGIIAGDVIRCGGWSRQETAKSGYSAWFCAIDLGGL